MRRLTRETAKEFSKTIKEDFARLKKEGLLERNKLDNEAYSLVNQLPIKHPDLYLNIRPLYESRNKTLKFGSNFIKKISPMYRQQERAMKKLDELTFTTDEIMRKIDDYEVEEGEDKNEN